MKPVMSYYGGKGRLGARIASLLPEHAIYAEPFAGGAAVFFAKRRSEREALNDHNERIVEVYRCLQNERTSTELATRIRNTPYARAEYERALTLADSSDPIERAWATIVSCNWSYGNKLDDGFWQYGRETKHHARSWANRIELLEQWSERLRGVYLDSCDALEFIERWDHESAVFYCDPPYPGANQGHYGGYTAEDFARLVELAERSRGSFLISNYEQTVPAHWERFEFHASTTRIIDGANVAAPRTEIVWRISRERTRSQMDMFR
jgi:DNA adenine methylase